MPEYGPLSYEGLPPASGAWREGDPVGERRFAEVGDVATESGAVIPQVRVAYETWGTLNDGPHRTRSTSATPSPATPTSPAGRPRAPRPAAGGTASSGPGARSTPTSGSSCAPTCSAAARARPARPRSPPTAGRGGAGSRSSRSADMVEVERRLTDLLGIDSWALMLGPSLGGMRVLEWMVRHPDRVRGGLVLGLDRRRHAPTRSAPTPSQIDGDRGRSRVPRRRLLRRARRRRPARGHGHRPTHRAPDLPLRDRARPAVRA